MDLIRLFCDGNPQLFYQFVNIPFAFLFYCLIICEMKFVSSIRYVYLTLGGFILVIVTVGPYSLLLFFSAVLLLLLIRCLQQMHLLDVMTADVLGNLLALVHPYWLQETPDFRYFSKSMNCMKTSILILFRGLSVLIPFLSYSLDFPALLEGPLCSFNTFVESVRQLSMTSPRIFSYSFHLWQVVVLVWIKYPLKELLKSVTFTVNSPCICQNIIWIWVLLLLLKMNCYAHWKVSECVNSAAGMGFHGYSHSGKSSWDEFSDGSPWVTEASSRPSVFARQWNRNTAVWLQRMFFKRSNRSPLFITFGFSAWWDGLHPDYKIHHFLHPKLTSKWRNWLNVCLNWAFTQLTSSCVVCVELQSLESVKLLWS
uniref:Membrane bound O-acyltransferase domain containing 4 n=1 Tax=Cyprinus carpio TaxID=7962 RepID=A0A8C1LIR9_CYPCA